MRYSFVVIADLNNEKAAIDSAAASIKQIVVIINVIIVSPSLHHYNTKF